MPGELQKVIKPLLRISWRTVFIILCVSATVLAMAVCTLYSEFGSIPKIDLLLLLTFYFLVPIVSVIVVRSSAADKIANLSIFRLTILLVLAWLPFLIAFYPGNIWYHDTCFQIDQFLGNEMPNIFSSLPGYSITDHHPYFDTVVFGSFIVLGMHVLGSAEAGYFAYVICQSLLTALVFSYGCNLLRHRDVSPRYVAAVILFFAFCPLFPFAVGSMAKDMLHAPLFLLFLFKFWEAWETKSISKSQLVQLTMLGMLLVLTKKTGFYISVLSLTALLLKAKGSRVRIVAVLAAIILVNSVIMPKIVLPAFNVSPGSSIEALALPIQQVSRAIVDNPEVATEDERKAIDALIGYDTIPDRFNPQTSDGVKGIGSDPNVNYYPSTPELLAFIKAWLSIGLRQPSSYLKATIELEAGWFSLNTKLTWFDMVSEHGFPIQPPNGAAHIERPEGLRDSAETVSQAWVALGSIAGYKLFFQPAVYTWIIPIAATIVALRKKKPVLVSVPIYLSCAVLMLSPISINNEALRYALPLVYSAPFLIGAQCCRVIRRQISRAEH